MKNRLNKRAQSFLSNSRAAILEYPRQFWILVGAAFIDRLGGALLFPFFTLYLTRKFAIGMTQVGVIFGVFAISSFIGSMIGGALTDRIGRKSMLIFGLVMSSVSSVLMGVIDVLPLFIVVALVVGILSESGGPAQQALVADLLPEKQRAGGFGIIRVAFNLAVTIGPVIGGFLASRSYLLLFISDAVTSLITALIAYFALHETRHKPAADEPKQSMGETFRGYFKVLGDKAYIWFLLASTLMVLVYLQMNTTLAVYLRDMHGISEQGFGYILSLNAGMVVLFQFAVTRWVNRYNPLMVMTAGTLLYAIGFAMYGFVGAYSLFLAAMVVITIGEMMVSPVGQAIVARLAPEDMRGRYMAVFGFSWLIPIAIGPFLAGMVMDNWNPDWVWYLAGTIGLLATGAYYWLAWQAGRARHQAIDERLRIVERLEEGHITAEQAAHLLEIVEEGVWTRLTHAETEAEKRHVRIQVSELGSGVMKSDLRIPVGLVSTLQHTQGYVSDALIHYDQAELKDKIALGAAGHNPQHLKNSDESVEITIE
ncbi:MAG TPA: MFS transporter [Anaerolineales bacterium]|nr:MFS transporter [Anaerolineales bacterium]